MVRRRAAGGRGAAGGLRGWLGRLIGSGGQSDSDVEAEIRFHLEERLDELVAAGVAPAEARRRVEAEFGDVARIEEETRRIARQRVGRQRWRDGLERLGQDASFALRVFRRSPGFAVSAILTLALGIGATTAVFSVVDAVLIRPLPYPDPDELVVVWESRPSRGVERDQVSPPNYVDWRDGTRSFEGLAAWELNSATLTGVDRPEVLDAARVSANFFTVLGATPLAGRVFRPDEGVAAGSGAGAVLVSEGLWRRLGAAASPGSTLRLDGAPREVLGVMPDGFAAPTAGIDVWLLADFDHPSHLRTSRSLGVLGRLADGVDRAAAEAELDVVAAALSASYPESNAGYETTVVSARDQVVSDSGRLLTVLLGAVSLLLLLACVNVSNMLLGRALDRSRELAVRSALGASGGRLRTQMLVESLVLGGAAGALGVALARVGVAAILASASGVIPRAEEVAVDGRVLLAAAAISLVTAIALGLVPALRASGSDPAGSLRAGAGGVRRAGARRALAAAEVGLSLVLLVGAGLLARTLIRLAAVDTGYATEHVITARVDLDPAAYPSGEPRVRYFETLVERVRALPQVEAAGITSTIPLSPAGIDFDLPYRRAEDAPVPEEELPQVDYRIASAGYTEAMGMRLVRGRPIEPADRAGGRRVVVVNESLARQLWPGTDPIGRRLVVHYVDDAGLEWEVVGVVGDTRHHGLDADTRPQIFIPLGQAEYLFGYMSLVARTRGGPGVADALRSAAVEVDPAHPLFDVETIEQLRSEAMARERVAAVILAAFALLALVLAGIGIYGVVSYQVARRTREIGVRMALGAPRRRVLWLVMADVAATAAVGVVAGLAVAALASTQLEALLYDVDTLDPATYAATSLLLLAAAATAGWLPAHRAASVDPVTALRTD